MSSADGPLARVAALLAAEGRGDATASLTAAPPEHRLPVVVFAGEDKRGKSTLVNALVGAGDLSPTGVRPTTACPVTLFYSPEPTATVTRYGEGTTEVAPEEASALARLDPDLANEGVVAVAIGVDAPLLARMTLVDTPGVGGLDSGHAALTLQVLSAADALVFVTDSASPLRAAEVRFVARAAERIENVIVVLTKVDVHPGWRAIMADDQRILREASASLARAPLVPVAAALASTSGDARSVAAARDESGVMALEALLAGRVADRADRLQRDNRVRAALSALGEVGADLSARTASLQPDGVGRARLEAERARLQELRDAREGWPERIDVELDKLAAARRELLAKRSVEIRHRYEERLKRASGRELDALPGEVLADLLALAAELDALSAARVGDVVGALREPFEALGLEPPTPAQLDPLALREHLQGLEAGKRSLRHTERMNVLTDLTRGLSLLSVLPGAALILGPTVGVLVGVGVGGLLARQGFRERHRETRAEDITSWMGEQVAVAEAVLGEEFAGRMTQVRADLKSQVRKALSAREQEISSDLAEAQQLLASSQEELEARREALARRAAEIRAATNDLEGLLSGGSGSGSSSGVGVGSVGGAR